MLLAAPTGLPPGSLRSNPDLCHSALSRPRLLKPNMRTRQKTQSVSSVERRVETEVRRQAEQQARNVPWPILLESRKQYIDWEAFTLWVRAITEAEHQAPEWLCRTVKARCPSLAIQQNEKLWKGLDRWKRQAIFAKPHREGWMRAVGFYAVRDIAYARNWAYWEHCEGFWSARRPPLYPSFEEWKAGSENCPDEVVDASGLRPERKEMVKAARRAGRERLERAVETYIDIEALTGWLRPILCGRPALPASVIDEIKGRYPFLDLDRAWRPEELRDHLERSQLQEARAGG
jgi:hypothetical protein